MEDTIVKVLFISAITIIFSLIFWGLSFLMGIVWLWWFVPIIFMGAYAIFD